MKKSIIRIILLGILIGIGILFWPELNQQHEQHSANLISSDHPQGGNFVLNANTGKVSLDDFKGKLVLLYFGYTFCPDICPTNLGNLAVAYHKLTPEQQKLVQVIFISVDPVRDTPARLEQYTSYFEMNAIGLTGEPNTLMDIARKYGVIYLSHQKSPEDMHYSVDHSAFTYVVDANGQLQTQLPHATSPSDFVKIIKKYLPPTP